MSCFVKGYSKRNHTTYVYSSTAVWDPVRKCSVPKRRLVGKIDPATGEVVPTGKPGRPRKAANDQPVHASADGDTLQQLQEDLKNTSKRLRDEQETSGCVQRQLKQSQLENARLEMQLRDAINSLRSIQTATEQVIAACEKVLSKK